MCVHVQRCTHTYILIYIYIHIQGTQEGQKRIKCQKKDFPEVLLNKGKEVRKFKENNMCI